VEPSAVPEDTEEMADDTSCGYELLTVHHLSSITVPPGPFQLTAKYTVQSPLLR